MTLQVEAASAPHNPGGSYPRISVSYHSWPHPTTSGEPPHADLATWGDGHFIAATVLAAGGVQLIENRRSTIERPLGGVLT